MKLPFLFILTFSIFIGSCKKFIEVGPPKDLILSSAVYSNDATATAVMKGIYSQMTGSGSFASGGVNSVTFLTGLSADEFKNFRTDPTSIAFYTNSLTP